MLKKKTVKRKVAQKAVWKDNELKLIGAAAGEDDFYCIGNKDC